VPAIADLSFTVPRGQIIVLLESNGAGKSTALGVLAGLIGRSGGPVVFPGPAATGKLLDKEEGGQVQWEGPSRPASGALGIMPQKNVLFPELTCLQTMQLWSAVKRPIEDHSSDAPSLNQRLAQVKRTPAEFERLLQDCGLEGKLHSNAGSLSGG
jgi:ABC-type multidrug transport system ATPase subunit